MPVVISTSVLNSTYNRLNITETQEKIIHILVDKDLQFKSSDDMDRGKWTGNDYRELD